MNYIIISPHFPENYRLFSIALAKAGVKVLGIADADDFALPHDLRSSLTDYYKVSDMENYEELYRAVAYFAHKHGRIHKIDSFNEYWLEFEAGLRTDFNIPGINSSDISAMKHKSLMKQKFIKAGINVARGKVLDNLPDAIRFINEVGYPVVAKPDKGVGAWNTFKIHSPEELENFFAVKPANVDYILEEFINGDIQSFDGLVDSNGKLVFYTGHQYETGVMEIVNDDTDTYYYSFREVPQDLYDAGTKILKEFKLKERFFHFEFFRVEDGGLVALEVNMRPPGGFTTDMFNYANDFNIYSEFANIVTHNTFIAPVTRKYHVCYISRKFNKNYIHSHEEIINNYSGDIVMNAPMSGVFRGALGDYGYIIRSEKLKKIKEIIKFIHAKM